MGFESSSLRSSCCEHSDTHGVYRATILAMPKSRTKNTGSESLLRSFRALRNKTKSEFAAALSVSTDLVSGWEDRTQPMSVDHLNKAREFLELTDSQTLQLISWWGLRCLVAEFPSIPATKKKVDRDKVRSLFVVGKSDVQIAEAVAGTVGTVRGCRLQMGLRRHRGSRPRPDYRQIRELFEAGRTDEEIADTMELSLGQIRWHRLKMGLKRERPGRPDKYKIHHKRIQALFEGDWSDEEISEEVGIDLQAVESCRNKLGLKREKRGKYTPYYGEIRELFEAECPDSIIADLIGISQSAVQQQRMLLGLKKPRGRKPRAGL